MTARRQHTIPVVVTMIAGLALAACSTAPASSAGGSAQASAGDSAVASARPSTASVSVDLVFSDAIDVVAKGTAGECTLGKDSAGTVTVFGFRALEADYPGLGQGFFVSEGNGGYVTLKLLLDASTGYLNNADIVGAVSADHHSIQLDEDLAGGDAQTVHVKGSIVCP